MPYQLQSIKETTYSGQPAILISFGDQYKAYLRPEEVEPVIEEASVLENIVITIEDGKAKLGCKQRSPH